MINNISNYRKIVSDLNAERKSLKTSLSSDLPIDQKINKVRKDVEILKTNESKLIEFKDKNKIIYKFFQIINFRWNKNPTLDKAAEIIQKAEGFLKSNEQQTLLDTQANTRKQTEESNQLNHIPPDSAPDDPIFYSDNPINNLPFYPIFKIDGQGFDFFAEQIKKHPLPEGIKIHLDYQKREAFFGYTSKELEALSRKNTAISEMVYVGYRTVFEGYAHFRYDFQGEITQCMDLTSILNDDKVKQLIQHADKFFHNLNLSNPNVSIPQNSTHKEIVDLMLKDHSGIIIGEIHRDSSPKSFLISQMPNFKSAGVDTLFLEHLFYDTIQHDLDDYFNSPSDQLPSILEQTLKRTEIHPDETNNYKNVIMAAKKNGIRVVAIDTSVSYKAGWDDHFGAQGANRYKGMNYTASKIIERERGNGKYVALVGSAHSSTCEGVPGMREILNCPSLVIEDSSQDSIQLKVLNHGSNSYEPGIEKTDVLLYIKHE